MAEGKETSLSLVIKAVDRATGPLRAMTAKLTAITAPFKGIGKDRGDFSKAAGLKEIGAAAGGVKSALGGVGSEAFALGARLAGVGAAAGAVLVGITKNAIESGDELATVADRVGLGVDAFASLRYAANQADVPAEEFTSAMDKLNKNLGAAKANTGPLLELLNKVAPTLARQFQAAKTTEEAFSLVTDAMARLPDPARRAELATAAFGKSGAQMGVFLHQGSAAIQEQQLKYLKLAGSQKDFAAEASDADNAVKDLAVSFTGLRSAAFTQLFPVFTELTKSVTGFVVANRDGISKWAKETAASIQAWINGGGIDRLAAGLKDLVATVGKFVDYVGGIEGVAKIAAVILAGPLLSSVLGLVPAIISLTVALAPLAVALAPFVVAAAPFIAAAAGVALAAKAIYDNWADVKLLFKDGILGDVSNTLNDAAAAEAGLVPDSATVPSTALGARAGRPLTADDARAFSSQPQRSEARLTVDFANAPRGTRVTPAADNTTDVDLSVGYANAGF